MKLCGIRPATTADAQAISTLIFSITHFFTSDPQGAGAEAFFETIAPEAIAKNIEADNYAYFVATHENMLIGVAALRDAKHVYSLYVDGKEHGQGIAHQLWQTLKNAALEKGNYGEFTVNSSLHAQAIYSKWGFIATAAQQEMHGLRFIPMQLSLENPI